MQIQSKIKYSFYLAGLAVLFLFVAHVTDRYHVLEPAPTQVQNKVEQHIESTFEKLHEQIQQLEAEYSDINEINWRRQNDFKYPLYIYQQNQLVYWNHNRLNLPLRIIQFDEGVHFIRLPGGFYVFEKIRSKQYPQTDYLYFIPLKYIFPLQNQHLQNHFAEELGIPDYYEITTDETVGAIAITYQDNDLFYLYGSVQYAEASHVLVIICYFLFLILVIAAVFSFARFFAQRFNSLLVLVLFSGVLIFLRALMITFGFPAAFDHLHLFNPALYASSMLFNSLGDLIINCSIIFTIILFYFRYIPDKAGEHKLYQWGLFVVSFLSTVLMLVWMASLFRSQVIDSSISLEIDNFFSLDIYSIVAILIANVLLLGFILLGVKTLRIGRDLISGRKGVILLAAIFSIAVLLVGLKFLSGNLIWFLVIWSLLAFFTFYQLSKEGRKIDYLSDTLVIAGLMGVFSAMFYYHYTEEKTSDNILFMARKLAIDRDPVTEFLFDDIEMRLAADPFVKNYFLNPHFPFRELADRLQSIYFSGYFNKYELRLFSVNSRGDLIDGTSDLERFNEEALGITGDVQLTSNDHLFFIPRPDGTYAYIGNLPVLLQDKVIGSLIIELTPKVYRKNYLYPELLLEERKKPLEELEIYDYAVYINNKLITRQGRFPYNFFVEREITLSPGEHLRTEFNQRQHYIYLADESKLVVISREIPSLMQPVTYFSYLFCFNLLCIVLFRVFRYGKNQLFPKNHQSVKGIQGMTFRGKMQLAMLSVIVFSFAVIGAVTFFHFNREYNKSFQERLLEKEEAVQASINYQMNTIMQNVGVQGGIRFNPLQYLTSHIFELADIHAIDINIYSTDGSLLLTSQPGIFEKGLISELMHPDAVHSLINRNRSQLILNEKIGELEFLSVYVPIRDEGGAVLGYLNLPYFEKEKNLNREISGFFVALVNVYVLLLLGGGLAAFFIGNSLTQSLATIGQKLQKVKLGKQNEPIEWESDDEIGALVSEYNKMIKELEKSAKLLAKSEREFAWREMAKQIAHEIKNPLTPMKLRIQHLQRAIKENNPNVDEMAEKVLNSLIEQIDTLSHIATEFSSFAKMPRANFEPLNIVETARSSLEIFNQNSEHVHLSLNSSDEVIKVYADKQQINRVFNNLIKNAVQSIPSEQRGTVLVEIKKDPGENTCTIAVRDNGCGIPEHLKENVFVPNFTTKSSGMGLGLAMAKQIIQNASGEIWFESEEDKGTTFYFKLKLYEAVEEELISRVKDVG